jgi:hypothetical protein
MNEFFLRNVLKPCRDISCGLQLRFSQPRTWKGGSLEPVSWQPWTPACQNEASALPRFSPRLVQNRHVRGRTSGTLRDSHIWIPVATLWLSKPAWFRAPIAARHHKMQVRRPCQTVLVALVSGRQMVAYEVCDPDHRQPTCAFGGSAKLHRNSREQKTSLY